MRGLLSCLGVVLALVHLSQQLPEQDKKDYYIAAVVEYTPEVVWLNPKTLIENAKLYTQFMKNATLQGADIIVFPEDGLTSFFFPDLPRIDPWTTFVPTAEEKYIPCTQNRAGISDAMKLLSCAARDNKIYVVINLVEKALGADRSYYYNTNVVFDRKGQIIARYRKTNLVGAEKLLDVENPSKIATFDTDFGVRFGTFICFDMIFSIPGLNMTRDLGITDFVYPTAWFSEVPFLTAVQIQFGWSFAEDVNLLVSGYNNPLGSNTGSGIYLGRDGIAKATFSYTNGRKMLVSRVPKKAPRNENKEPRRQGSSEDRGKCYVTNLWTPSDHGVLKLMLDIFDQYESAVVNGPLFEKTLCHAGFCCDFQVNSTLSQSPSSHYRAVVYKGCRHYGDTNSGNGIRVCGLTQCSNSSLSSCGIVREDDVRFNSVKITATYDDDLSNSHLMPSILDTKLLPFDDISYVEEKIGNITRLTLAVDTPKDDLAAFAIYTRDYWYDHIV